MSGRAVVDENSTPGDEAPVDRDVLVEEWPPLRLDRCEQLALEVRVAVPGGLVDCDELVDRSNKGRPGHIVEVDAGQIAKTFIELDGRVTELEEPHEVGKGPSHSGITESDDIVGCELIPRTREDHLHEIVESLLS